MENFGRFQTFGKDITNSQIPNVGHVGHLNQNYGFDYVSCSNGNQQQGLPVYCPPQVYVEYEPLCDQCIDFFNIKTPPLKVQNCIYAMKQTMDLVVKRVKRVGPLLLLRNCQDIEGIYRND
ncbi:hypothetical protein RUM43_004166 [Polyplax serrata]|uniref:Uncharacterized protein n=1 Tax=Polyplax serrata TaxID=468196 RepID=A0AAN8SBE4_POLSC